MVSRDCVHFYDYEERKLMPDYRVLVTGSRDWPHALDLYAELSQILSWAWVSGYSTMTVVHGDCPTGADSQASHWCRSPHALAGISVIEEAHPADWKNHGKAAGFMRNSVMVGLGADECLAFIYNESRGASHCAGQAEFKGIPTRRFVL
jgi:hypothetical protein